MEGWNRSILVNWEFTLPISEAKWCKNNPSQFWKAYILLFFMVDYWGNYACYLIKIKKLQSEGENCLKMFSFPIISNILHIYDTAVFSPLFRANCFKLSYVFSSVAGHWETHSAMDLILRLIMSIWQGSRKKTNLAEEISTFRLIIEY